MHAFYSPLSAGIDLLYLAAAVLFVLGLKGMSHPRTAVRGNLLGALGMALAIGTALLDPSIRSYVYIAAGLALGALIGVVLATRVQMTGMPQMVALLNGFGGAASVFVAWAELIHNRPTEMDVLIATALSAIIGAVTFSGSLLAFGKLEEFGFLKQPYRYPGQQGINLVLALLVAGIAIWMCIAASPAEGSLADPDLQRSPATALALYTLLVVVSLALGVLLVNPIGGADMPVVISLLNSYSGIAAAATGFVIGNNVLIIGGSLVGASGIILTRIMCQAMNRSLTNVLFGLSGPAGPGASADSVYARVRSTSPDDVAMLLDGAQRVVVVPGYGLAVAQAQHAVRELSKTLEERGTTVEFAIHPVAGRMPGHMNVLLAEADIGYEKLKEMDAINPTLDTVDMAIVIGANDVVNPVAKTDPKSPIAGMPIIEVDRCRTVVVVKRSLSPGFAGIPNPLFAADNTLMLFADGKDAVLDIVKALKSG